MDADQGPNRRSGGRGLLQSIAFRSSHGNWLGQQSGTVLRPEKSGISAARRLDCDAIYRSEKPGFSITAETPCREHPYPL
jgi:hypothetical protein